MKDENAVKKAVIKYLDKFGWFHFPIIQNFKKAQGMRGVPDRIAMKNGVVLFIEIKKPGGVLSEYQELFKASCEHHGCIYVVVEDVGDLYYYI